MIKLLYRGVPSCRNSGTRAFSFTSSSSSVFRLFSSTSSPSSLPSSAVTGAAADVADVSGEENLVYPETVAPSVAKLENPGVLQPRVVIYDGVCHLCHRGVKWVIQADKHRKIKFCCLQSKAADPYLSLCGLDREDVLRCFVFIEGLGLYHQASTAALRVMSYLPLPYSALSSLLLIPTPIRDAVYDHVAKHRYEWFGKAEDCLVLQEKEMLERFIDREEMMNHS
ncbi:Dcc family protein, chloroplastic [Quillaja saponaria]|uniref:Dcc family protein, chloroplastic n=1 Tax=Quillaja saponaria TaxID=32244 RepID=A0AAD7L8M7_QUISA|nr:Dcc family protein, chloroplastic [Quillaja saponaria]